MSLTKFIKREDVKEKLEKEFPLPSFNLTGKILAPPQTTNYPIVGTAFDYLLRFHIERLNPLAVKKEWVADYAAGPFSAFAEKEQEFYNNYADAEVALIKKPNYYEWSIINWGKSKEYILEKSVPNKKIGKILDVAKQNYTEYLRTGLLSEDLLKDCLCLAYLDGGYRGDKIDLNKVGNVEIGDVKDLQNLIEVVNENDFKAKRITLLNPTFGKASRLVNGADVDIIIDNTMIDIKTTKYLNFGREYFDQLIGYYLLYLIGGIDNAPKDLNIEFMGIYYSRYGLLYKFPIKDVTKDCDIKKIISWFKKTAKDC